VLLVIDCSQKTCSGHCTTALLRIRFNAYVRWLAYVDSRGGYATVNLGSADVCPCAQTAGRCMEHGACALSSLTIMHLFGDNRHTTEGPATKHWSLCQRHGQQPLRIGLCSRACNEPDDLLMQP
jgi:hypothetical protein